MEAGQPQFCFRQDKAAQLAGRGRILGVSCYNEWARAEAGAAAGVDYLAFGAVYPSPTKPHAPRAGLELLAQRGHRLLDDALRPVTIPRNLRPYHLRQQPSTTVSSPGMCDAL